MNSVILVELIKGKAPLWPRLENDDYWMVVGSSRPMEDAWRIAQVEMIHWLSEILGLHYMDAYQLVTQVSLSPIANCVDTNYSVVTKIPKAILPKAAAYDGIHQRLRDIAPTVM
jgi:acetamidase/formamidase